MRHLLGPYFLLLALLTGVVSASAQDGVMNSIAFQKVSPHAALQVQPLDNSDANLALQTEFEAALREQGFTLSDTAPLVLTFETRDQIGAWTTNDRRHVLSFDSKGGRGGGENAKARLNVFDSQSGGLLNKGSGGTTIATPSSYRIDVSIEERATGKRLWQGWSEGKLAGGRGRDLTHKMVPALVEGIGKTVRQRTFDLY